MKQRNCRRAAINCFSFQLSSGFRPRMKNKSIARMTLEFISRHTLIIAIKSIRVTWFIRGGEIVEPSFLWCVPENWIATNLYTNPSFFCVVVRLRAQSDLNHPLGFSAPTPVIPIQVYLRKRKQNSSYNWIFSRFASPRRTYAFSKLKHLPPSPPLCRFTFIWKQLSPSAVIINCNKPPPFYGFPISHYRKSRPLHSKFD